MPFRRENRRIPTYVGVRIENNRIVIPANMEENDKVLKGWRRPTSRVMGIKPPTYYIPPPPDSSDVETSNASQDSRQEYAVPKRPLSQEDSEESSSEPSENDSEASTTDAESDDEQSSEDLEPVSQPSPSKSRRVEFAPKVVGPETSGGSGGSPAKPTSEALGSTVSLARYTAKLELNPEFTDLIFETSLQNYQRLEKDANRSILTVERNLEEDALSVFPTTRSPDSFSVSKIYDKSSDSHLISLYDLQRLIGFIAGNSLTDKQKARLNKQLDDTDGRHLVSTETPLFHTISEMRNPKPYVRVTFPIYVVQWKDVDALITKIFEADGVCVTVL